MIFGICPIDHQPTIANAGTLVFETMPKARFALMFLQHWIVMGIDANWELDTDQSLICELPDDVRVLNTPRPVLSEVEQFS